MYWLTFNTDNMICAHHNTYRATKGTLWRHVVTTFHKSTREPVSILVEYPGFRILEKPSTINAKDADLVTGRDHCSSKLQGRANAPSQRPKP